VIVNQLQLIVTAIEMEGKEMGLNTRQQRLFKKKVNQVVEALSKVAVSEDVSLEEKDYFTPPLMVSFNAKKSSMSVSGHSSVFKLSAFYFYGRDVLTTNVSYLQDVWPAIIDFITEPTDLKSMMVAGPVFSELIGSRRLPELVSK